MNLFLEFCKVGDLDKAAKLYKSTCDIDWAFRLSCKNGHLEVAKWLHSVGADVHACNDYSFIWSCAYGHLEVAQWLYSLGAPVNRYSSCACAFIWSCEDGHIDVAQWLHSISTTSNGHAMNDKAFRKSCKYGHIEVSQWLLDIDPCFAKRLQCVINTEYNIGEILTILSHHGKLHVIDSIISNIS